MCEQVCLTWYLTRALVGSSTQRKRYSLFTAVSDGSSHESFTKAVGR
jgi:hypothetical protein